MQVYESWTGQYVTAIRASSSDTDQSNIMYIVINTAFHLIQILRGSVERYTKKNVKLRQFYTFDNGTLPEKLKSWCRALSLYRKALDICSKNEILCWRKRELYRDISKKRFFRPMKKRLRWREQDSDVPEVLNNFKEKKKRVFWIIMVPYFLSCWIRTVVKTPENGPTAIIFSYIHRVHIDIIQQSRKEVSKLSSDRISCVYWAISFRQEVQSVTDKNARSSVAVFFTEAVNRDDVKYKDLQELKDSEYWHLVSLVLLTSY